MRPNNSFSEMLLEQKRIRKALKKEKKREYMRRYRKKQKEGIVKIFSYM